MGFVFVFPFQHGTTHTVFELLHRSGWPPTFDSPASSSPILNCRHVEKNFLKSKTKGKHLPGSEALSPSPELTGSLVSGALLTCLPKTSSWNWSNCTTRLDRDLLVGGSACMYWGRRDGKRNRVQINSLPPPMSVSSWKHLEHTKLHLSPLHA